MSTPIHVQWFAKDVALVSVGEEWTCFEFADYTLGYVEPNYPVPALIAGQDQFNTDWKDCRQAIAFFHGTIHGGINWTWAYFAYEQDAISFDLWCTRNWYETRGVYPPHNDNGFGVRFR